MGDDQTAAERLAPIVQKVPCKHCGHHVNVELNEAAAVHGLAVVPVSQRPDRRGSDITGEDVQAFTAILTEINDNTMKRAVKAERDKQALLDAIGKHRQAVEDSGCDPDLYEDWEIELWQAADAVEAVLSDTQTDPEPPADQPKVCPRCRSVEPRWKQIQYDDGSWSRSEELCRHPWHSRGPEQERS